MFHHSEVTQTLSSGFFFYFTVACLLLRSAKSDHQLVVAGCLFSFQSPARGALAQCRSPSKVLVIHSAEASNGSNWQARQAGKQSERESGRLTHAHKGATVVMGTGSGAREQQGVRDGAHPTQIRRHGTFQNHLRHVRLRHAPATKCGSLCHSGTAPGGGRNQWLGGGRREGALCVAGYDGFSLDCSGKQ